MSFLSCKFPQSNPLTSFIQLYVLIFFYLFFFLAFFSLKGVTNTVSLYCDKLMVFGQGCSSTKQAKLIKRGKKKEQLHGVEKMPGYNTTLPMLYY